MKNSKTFLAAMLMGSIGPGILLFLAYRLSGRGFYADSTGSYGYISDVETSLTILGFILTVFSTILLVTTLKSLNRKRSKLYNRLGSLSLAAFITANISVWLFPFAVLSVGFATGVLLLSSEEDKNSMQYRIVSLLAVAISLVSFFSIFVPHSG
jgi:hypothetical protein